MLAGRESTLGEDHFDTIETLECFYQQKIVGLRERLNKENSSWNVIV